MIEIDNVWKQYKLGNTIDLNKTFREALSERFTKTSKPVRNDSHFWALQDINLSVKPGSTLGLIGHNGAGKSTLLKVLSRITKPSRGQITIHGSLSSLLEVGTGFHPELSGRENIYLYGAIMGLSRRDIDKKFDQIVDYAGVERFLETPVKRYSSGMYVRLAFSIAAHVEPDILIVDEVLAVGDKEFREKCLGKMEDVADSGRTVIFVSHNMTSIASLCQEVAWLDHGQIKQVGVTTDVINAYENNLINSNTKERASKLFNGNLKETLILESLTIQGVPDAYSTTVKSDEAITISATWRPKEPLKRMTINMSLYVNNNTVMTLDDVQAPTDVTSDEFISTFTIPAKTFKNAEITIAIGGKEKEHGRWCWAKGVAKITTISDGLIDQGSPEDVLMPIGEGKRHNN